MPYFLNDEVFVNYFFAILFACALLTVACCTWDPNPTSTSGQVVIYARYSTDNQRETSIDDQIRTVKIRLTQLSIDHQNAIILSDKGISGEREDRENYQKVRTMIRAGQVSILACDEVSRLTRGSTMGVIADEMELYGCRFITADGYDSVHDSNGFLVTLKGKMAGMDNRHHAHRVRRGIAGRTLDGNGADGTHPFGYSTHYCNPEEARNYRGVGPKPKKEVVPNQAEAAIVLEIFTKFASGMSQSEIAQDLNKRNILPGKQSNRCGKGGSRHQNGWSKALIGKMLKQRKYIGTWVWGEFKHRKLPNGKRLVRRANPSAVVQSERPTLAIVPRELWDAVQARLKQNREKYGFKKGQKKRGARIHCSSDYPSNILSGLLFCGVCGSRMHFTRNNSDIAYRCPIAQRNGTAGGTQPCHQKGWIPYDRAVAALTEHLQEELSHCREWVDDVYTAAVAEYRKLSAGLPNELSDIESRLSEVKRAIDNMMVLAESGDAPASLIERLRQRESEQRELESARERLARRKDREVTLPDVEWVKAQLENLPGVLNEDPRKAAFFFRKFFGKVFGYSVIAPGKKRGHAEIAFKTSRLSAIGEVLVIDGGGASPLENANTDISILQGDVIRIALPSGNDKLDKLMPIIDALVQNGKTWKAIAAELKISKTWANRYYRIWKAAKAEEANQAV